MVGRGWEVGAGGGRWGSGVITAGESRGGRGVGGGCWCSHTGNYSCGVACGGGGWSLQRQVASGGGERVGGTGVEEW